MLNMLGRVRRTPHTLNENHDSVNPAVICETGHGSLTPRTNRTFPLWPSSFGNEPVGVDLVHVTLGETFRSRIERAIVMDAFGAGLGQMAGTFRREPNGCFSK